MAAGTHENTPRPCSRACDRCRRRKIKCDSSDPSRDCINCHSAGKQCTFELPVSRRGPKAKRRQLATEAQRVSFQNPVPITQSLQETSRHRPSSRGLYQNAATSESLGIWASEVVTSALSPVTVQTVATPLSHAASTGSTLSSIQRWGALARELHVRQPTVVLEDLINRCFKLFFDYLFPLIPLVHEPSLRNGLAFFVARENSGNFEGASRGSRNDEILSYSGLWPDATFTLITAVCAETAFLLPKEIFPEGEMFAEAFLEASRNCLFTYLEADIEHPNANSVVIRYFHSNCMHAAGKPRFSWHIFGEASRLAQTLQMHDEESIQRLDPLEAEFRRRVFWIIYIGDKSAAILNSRPITIHKFSFEAGITIGYPTGFEGDENHLGPSGNTNANGLSARKSFLPGFNANLRLWQTASDLLLETRLVNRKKISISPIDSHHCLTVEDRQRLDHLYVLFVTSLDDLPPFLNDDQLRTHTNSNSDEMNSLLKTYTIQATNLHISLHCLKMVITRKFEEINYFPMGDNEILLLRKTEIARNMLRIVRESPFWALQVNGEPCVEKIRLIGARLLEIIDQHETSPLSARAQADLSVFLDILTRLDSKASDTLRRSL